MFWFGLPVIVSVFIGFILFYRFPVLELKEKKSDTPPKISIIIPARDEEYNLPALLSSLKNQTVLPHEIIVVDDNSNDGTVRTAKEHGAKVFSSGPLPEGWMGKPWSCFQGAGRAKGDLFVFLDADTFLAPDALEKIACNFSKGEGAVSIFPFHRIKKIHESFSAIFNLMQLAGMYKVSIKRNPDPCGMFGPCLVISRKDYFKIQGHKSVRGEVLEHYIMAAVLIENNVPVRLFRGKGCINVRMYPEGWMSVIKGWSKSFTRGADQTPGLNMSLSVMWISGLTVSSVFFTYSLLFSGNMFGIYFWTAVYLICVIQVFILLRSIGNFPLWSALLYPLNLIFFLTVFTFSSYRSSKNRNVEWKGRKIN